MKLLSLFSILLFVVLSMVSCDKDNDKNTKIFSIVVTHNLTEINEGHIHMAPVGVNGPAVFPFSELTSSINYTSLPLNSEQDADLYASLYYVNLHTTTYPNGEIRGQLIKQ